jgi:acyl carrier protein
MDGQPGEMDEQIRRVLVEYGRIRADVATLEDSADLYRAGMNSHASVNVMIALEQVFDLEFPDYLLKKATFSSVAAIRAALFELTGGGQA